MAAPVTATFDKFTLEVETDTPGTYAVLCGLKDLTYSRTAEVNTIEVPADCTDESLPYAREKDVRSLEFVIEGQMVWAQQSHETLLAWFYTGATKNVRLRHVNAAVGDVEYETGAALLTNLSVSRTKGDKVNGEFRIEFDGTPTRTDKSA
jgi:hypothetical protein